MGENTCALFLRYACLLYNNVVHNLFIFILYCVSLLKNSLKYHRQYPNYLAERLGAINNLPFKLRLVFCLVDLVPWDDVITLFSFNYDMIVLLVLFFPKKYSEKWWTRNGRGHTFVSWFKMDINSVMEVLLFLDHIYRDIEFSNIYIVFCY